MTELIKNGRPGVKKVVLFMTDGEANQPDAYNPNTCQYAYDMATAAKKVGIEIFTVGFGVSGIACSDPSGSYSGIGVTTLLADMATQPSDDDCDSASSSSIENTDNDHFFCQPKSQDLKNSFIKITEALIPGAKLVGIPSEA